MDREKQLSGKGPMRIKPIKKQKIGWIILLFIVLVFGVIASIQTSPKYDKKAGFLSQAADIVTEKKKTIYPSQYSDAHITSNAIIADPQYRSLSYYEKTSQLASLISASQYPKSANTGTASAAEEKGTWLWTPTLDITPSYRKTIIDNAKKAGLNAIYLSVDSYLDIYVMQNGPEKDAKKKLFGDTLDAFIKEANASGIAVDAEAGWRNWAEDGNAYKAFGILNFVKDYNKTHQNKFRGFQYDIEPYLLDSYQKNKAGVLADFLDLVNETVTRLDKTSLAFSVVIPEFYDGTNGETPKFLYAGTTTYAVDHLFDILDRRSGSTVILMSYRNFSKGDDGSIEISQDEIGSADKHATKIIVAQETGDVEPPYVTFYDTTLSYYKKQLALIESAFKNDKSFGGVAVHYANAFFSLK
jgi:hypothetical protein